MIAAENKKTKWLHLCILAVAVLIAYLKVFHAGFMSWDDGEYVLHNNDITSFDGTHIKQWFSTFYVGNYHPLTMLSYGIDFLLGRQQPFIYHFTNIALHAANACLLYLFIRKIQPQALVALFVALLFAVHPVQTESVSWIAERKTVLFTLFYLLALLRYAGYMQAPTTQRMLGVVLLGAAAMLSKGTAVALPLSLFAVDIWMQRSLRDKKIWLEKAPLLIIAAIIGVVAINAQESGKFMDTHAHYNVLDTMIYSGYAYTQYIIHFFIPTRLSVMYPYPPHTGALQYIYFILALGVFALGVLAYRKRWYVLCGGIAFYTVNIIFLLQFVQFGESLMADRYLYIAGIGLLYPAVHYLYTWLQSRSKEIIATISLGAVACLFLTMTFLRNDIWLSDLNFFDAMLKAFPESAVAQYSVGAQLMKMGDYDQAELHLDRAVSIDPDNYKAWHNKGALHLRQGRLMEALDALNRSIAINDYYKAYFTRAMLHQGSGKPAMALADIEKVLAVQPDNARALYIKADCLEQTGNTAAAMDNYNKAIIYSSAEPLFFIRRGLLHSKMKENNAAITDLNAAVAINPGNGEALYYRGVVKYQAGMPPCNDLRNALQHGYRQAQEAINTMCRN